MSDNSLPQSDNGDTVDTFATIPDVPIQANNSIVNPNQVRSGLTRGAQITTGADGYPQVLQGNQQTFGNGFYVAKPANDVTQVTDSANFIFNSNQNVFKIIASGSAEFSYTWNFVFAPTNGVDNSSLITINHNLGYVPLVQTFLVNSGSSEIWERTYIHRLESTGASISRRSLIVTDTQLIFQLIHSYWSTSGGVTGFTDSGTIRYFILQESVTS